MPKAPKVLAKVINQTEEAKGLVEEAAQHLSSVNSGLKQVIEDESPARQIVQTLEISETAEGKVQEAADKLALVNRQLKGAVHERHALEIQLAEVTELAATSRHASLHDPLTGLPNRALSNDRLEHGLAQAARHNCHLAVMFIDLDEFKKINDTYGHDAGDRVLKAIASRLTDITRADDTLSRHGGDEFLYVLTEYESERDLAPIAEKLTLLIQAPCEISVGENTANVTVSASIGIAVFPEHGKTSDELVKSADSAMYRAKRTRFRFAFAR